MHNYAVKLPVLGRFRHYFFLGGFGNGARAMVVNSALIRKIYRRVSFVLAVDGVVALVHFVPQIAVMLLACFLGWSPTFLAFGRFWRAC